MFNKDLLIFSFMTFITVMVWTSLEVYHVRTESTVPQNLKEAIEPLDPILKTEIIADLKSRFNENTLPKPLITLPLVSTKSAIASPSASPSPASP